MSIIPLMIQGALVGMLTGLAYPVTEWQFWAICIANSVLTAGYGAMRNVEA